MAATRARRTEAHPAPKVLIFPLGLLEVAGGTSGVVINPTWPARVFSAVLVVVGAATLAPIWSGRRRPRLLRRRSTYLAATVSAAVVLAWVVFAAAESLTDLTLAGYLLPIYPLIAAVSLPLLLARQHRHSSGLTARRKRDRRWCWYVATLLLAPIAAAYFVVGAHDVVAGTSCSSRALGLIACFAGLLAVTPIISASKPGRGLKPLAILAAALAIGGTGLAGLVAERASGPVSGVRLGVPIFLLATSALLPLLLWAQLRRSPQSVIAAALRRPLGKVVAANAALLALLQIGISLRSSTHPVPPRIVLNAYATPTRGGVAIDVHGANHSGADLPVLADVIDVVAAKCPNLPRGRQLEAQRRRERMISTGPGDTSVMLGILEVESCFPYSARGYGATHR
jgi:hypothetical protein